MTKKAKIISFKRTTPSHTARNSLTHTSLFALPSPLPSSSFRLSALLSPSSASWTDKDAAEGEATRVCNRLEPLEAATVAEKREGRDKAQNLNCNALVILLGLIASCGLIYIFVCNPVDLFKMALKRSNHRYAQSCKIASFG